MKTNENNQMPWNQSSNPQWKFVGVFLIKINIFVKRSSSLLLTTDVKQIRKKNVDPDLYDECEQRAVFQKCFFF